ncbi:MAG: carbohydrate-binding domain-containing protein [Clostridia bacterium]|nr:carbohydrate-binding domain-containing protein [Clostridia bacterium]
MKNSVKQNPARMNSVKKVGALFLTFSLLTAAPALAAGGPVMGGFQNRMEMNQNTNVALADSASEIVSGTSDNSASSIAKDAENASRIVMSDENSSVTISESGTYIVSGTCKDGSITVKKGATGVYLVLSDLDLTSTSSAALSVNKTAEVLIEVSGNVKLTDAENPEDETSEDAEVADAYDGAAIKVKAGAQVYMTGDGTLTVNGSAKNGIKAGDDASLIIAGDDLTVNITAANDGINTNSDLTILSGTVNVTATDDALHADRVLTLGSESENGPTVTVYSSTEGLEGTVVNIHSGNITVNSSDDAVNAANTDAAYEGELTYAINVTGGALKVTSGADGLDSNGDINLVGGSVSIRSASFGGEAGMDYDGSLYVSGDVSLNNQSGIAGPDNMGPMNGQFGPMNGQNMQPGQNGQPSFGSMNQNGQNMQPGQNGQPGFDGMNQNGQNMQPEQSGESSQPQQPMQGQPTDFGGQDAQTQPQAPNQNGQPSFDGMNQNGRTMPGMNSQPTQPAFGGATALPAQGQPMDFGGQDGQTQPQAPNQNGQPSFDGMGQNGWTMPGMNNQPMQSGMDSLPQQPAFGGQTTLPMQGQPMDFNAENSQQQPMDFGAQIQSQVPNQNGQLSFGGMNPGMLPEIFPFTVTEDAQTANPAGQILEPAFPAILSGMAYGWDH